MMQGAFYSKTILKAKQNFPCIIQYSIIHYTYLQVML